MFTEDVKDMMAKLFGLNHFNISGTKYSYIQQGEEKIAPRGLWIVRTELFTPPSDAVEEIPDYQIQWHHQAYFSMLHTDQWSKAILWYKNIDKLNNKKIKKYPHPIFVDKNRDLVYEALKNMDLTYNIIDNVHYPSFSDLGEILVEYYGRHISSSVYYPIDISRNISRLPLKRFINSFIQTAVYIAEQYEDERLINQFKPYLNLQYNIN